jgi:hypothetical protein
MYFPLAKNTKNYSEAFLYLNLIFFLFGYIYLMKSSTFEAALPGAPGQTDTGQDADSD